MDECEYMLHKRVYCNMYYSLNCCFDVKILSSFQDNMQSFVVHAVSFSATIAAEITHFTRFLVTNGFTTFYNTFQKFFLSFTLIKKRNIKLINSDTLGAYNIRKGVSNECCSFKLYINQRILKIKCIHKNILLCNCVQH